MVAGVTVIIEFKVYSYDAGSLQFKPRRIKKMLFHPDPYSFCMGFQKFGGFTETLRQIIGREMGLLFLNPRRRFEPRNGPSYSYRWSPNVTMSGHRYCVSRVSGNLGSSRSNAVHPYHIGVQWWVSNHLHQCYWG